MSALRKNIASQHIGFVLTNSSTGAPVTAGGAGNVVIDGGAQAACAGTFTHKGTGQWDYAPTQAETNGSSISFAFTGTSALQVGMQLFTVGYDPTQAQVSANVTQWNGSNVASAAAGIPKVDVDTIKTNPVVNGGTITFPTTATLASTTNISAGTITTVSGNVNGSVGSVTGSVASVIGAVASVTGNVGGNVVGSVASVVAPVTVGTNNDKTNYSLTVAYDAAKTALPASSYVVPPTANANADALLDRADGVETGRTVRQSMRLMLATLVGKLSGASTTQVTIRDSNDTKNRVIASVDSHGNRTAVLVDQT
jgi:hypothetical protein